MILNVKWQDQDNNDADEMKFGTFDNPLNQKEQIQDPFNQDFSEGDLKNIYKFQN